jgi:CheY-like chemotaxis protein
MMTEKWQKSSSSILKTTLKNINIEIATNGGHALGLAEQTQFQFVVSDYQMPGMNGTEMLKFWLQLPKERRPDKIVIISGYLSQDIADGSSKKNVSYFKKPIDENLLKIYLKKNFPEHFKEKTKEITPGAKIFELTQMALQTMFEKVNLRAKIIDTWKNDTIDYPIQSGLEIDIETEDEHCQYLISIQESSLLKMHDFFQLNDKDKNIIENTLLYLGTILKNSLIELLNFEDIKPVITEPKIWIKSHPKRDKKFTTQKLIHYFTIPGDILFRS